MFKYNFSSKHNNHVRNGFAKKVSCAAFLALSDFINNESNGEDQIVDIKAEYEYEQREGIIELIRHHLGETVNVRRYLNPCSVFKKHLKL